MTSRLMTNWSLATLAIGTGLCLAMLAAPARAYTPEDPVVAQMVERGIGFLGAAQAKRQQEKQRGGIDQGSSMLAAYAHHKVRQNPDHPLVKEGMKFALDYVQKAGSGRLPNETKAVYEASVALLLMLDIDTKKYAKEIQSLGDALLAVQKSHGGFGYFHEELGDISQTQYAVLAMWSLDQANFKVPRNAMAEAVYYLLRTQDPTGQWGYKGVDSLSIGRLVPQDNRTGHSLTTAGGGSILIGGDFFGVWGATKQFTSSGVSGLPPALKERTAPTEMEQKLADFNVPKPKLLEFVGRTENWFNANPRWRPVAGNWWYYYIYTLERYKSFLEVARGEQEKEPGWYNEVAESLRRLQGSDGGWANGPNGFAATPTEISTSFAVLFLIRSTKKAIGELNEGVLAGGYELPKDTTNIRVEGTQIKGKPVASAVTDLLSLLEEEDADSLESGSIPDDLKLASDPEQRRQQLSRLERLARGSESYQARRVAVRLLAQSDDLKVVPGLIYALSDPDSVVKRYARDGLRFISRRFDGFGMPEKPSDREVAEAIDDWRTWYNELDPGYVFLD